MPTEFESMHRAYSLFTVKAMNEDLREIEGVATTPTPDRMGDVIEPEGAKFTLPMPLIFQHDQKVPVGEVHAASVRKDGIRVKARIAKFDEPGALKTRLDEIWHTLKAGLIKGFSVGFKPIGMPERIKDGSGLRFKSWLWLELSLVTIPANAEATISVVKSLDAELLVASDRRRGIVRLDDDIIRRARRQQHPGSVFMDQPRGFVR
jgi:HK97 family phage prohead protease